ncbi:MAG: hypothetical protein CMJ87_12165 [Planctomycetes bacterium]|jgi:hypothetical protein|nr:hypothetical protein [Planctomycetota bacterium]
MAASCGYTRGLMPPAPARTVGVAFFGNEGKLPDLERDLHRELVRSLGDLVSAPLAAPQRADATVRGRILSTTRRGGVRDPENSLLESGLRIAVEARLWGPEGPLGPLVRQDTWVGIRLDRLGRESDARARALAQLADALILELFASPPPGPE